MKITPSPKHNRTLIASEIGTFGGLTHLPKTMEITIGYVNSPDVGAVTLAVTLDNIIIPAILAAFAKKARKVRVTKVRTKTGKCPKCGAKGVALTFESDPYQSDVNKDDTPIWQCAECQQQARDDI